MTSTELKPCPFCGGKAFYLNVGCIRHPWSGVGADAEAVTVCCDGCGATVPSDMYKDRVTYAWNRRAT